MDQVGVIEKLIDPKTIRILRLFIQDSSSQFYLREISKRSRVSVATCFRIIKKLIRLQIVDIKNIKKFKFYQLAQNESTDFLSDLLRSDRHVVSEFVNAASKLKNIERIVMHGGIEKNRANILLIGTGIDSGDIKRICADIKAQYNFVISSLSLTGEQFEQMSQMGLYSGEKKLLYQI